jgi:hypothetical protein
MKNIQTIEETVGQYGKAWNQSGRDNIVAVLRNCWAPDATYVDPQNPLVRGLIDLAGLIDSSYQQMPVRTFHMLSSPNFHINSGYFRWSVDEPGKETREGLDYFEYNDQNQLTRIVGFF